MKHDKKGFRGSGEFTPGELAKARNKRVSELTALSKSLDDFNKSVAQRLNVKQTQVKQHHQSSLQVGVIQH